MDKLTITDVQYVHSCKMMTLSEYACGACGMWWSVLGEQDDSPVRYCPSCGAKGTIDRGPK